MFGKRQVKRDGSDMNYRFGRPNRRPVNRMAQKNRATKKKRICGLRQVWLALGVTAAIILAGCNWTAPEEVTVQSDPEINVPSGRTDLGEILPFGEEDMDEIIVEPLRDAFEDGEVEGEVRDGTYTVDATQDFISIATDEFFEEEVELDEIEEDIDPVTFDVPDLAPDPIEESEAIGTIELPDGVEIDESFELDDIVEPGSGESFSVDDIEDIDIEADGYDEVSFEQGDFIAALSIDNASDDLEVTVDGTIVDEETTIEAKNSVTLEGPDQDDGELEFDLTDETLSNEFSLELEVVASDGETGSTFKFAADSFEFSDDATISGASGIEIPEEEVTGRHAVDFAEFPENVESVEIGDGHIGINVEQPAEWENVDTDVELTLYDDGDDLEADWDDEEQQLDLAGVELTDDSDLEVEYSVEVSGDDATIDLEEQVDVTVDVEVTELAELVVEDEDLSYSDEFRNDDLPDEVVDYVDEVTLADGSRHMSVGMRNRLPADVELRLSSEALLPDHHLDELESEEGFFDPAHIDREDNADELDEIVIEFEAGADPEETPQTEEISLLRTVAIDELPGYDDDDPYFDFNVEVVADPDNFDDGTNQLTLTDVELGESYALEEGQVSLDLDVAEIVVSDIDEDGSIPEEDDEDPMDLSELNEFLPEGGDIEGVQASILIAGIEGLKGNARLLAGYTDQGGQQLVLDLLDEEDKAEEGDLEDVDINEYPQEDFDIGDDGEAAKIPVYLSEVINEGPDDLEFRYRLEADELTIDLQGQDNGDDGDTQELSIGLDLTLPIRLNVEERTEWELEDDDGEPLLALEDDLLGRDPGDEDDTVQELLEQLAEVSLEFDLKNEIGLNLELELTDQDGDGEFEVGVQFGNGRDTIELSRADIEYIRTQEEFIPDIKLYLPAGDQTFNPDGALEMSAWARVQGEIEHTIDLADGDD